VSTAIRRYFRGATLSGMHDVQANQMRYYHFDHQGTVQCLTDSTGAVTDRFASDAWGVQVNRTGTSINRNWYVGNGGYYRHVDQASGYIRQRFLAFAGGRWYSRDPWGPQLTPSSPYTYADNTPTLRTDPTGLVPGNGLTITPVSKTARRCGDAEFTVKWGVPPNTWGYIIQHVIVDRTDDDCFGGIRTPPRVEYWEAWPVLGGVVHWPAPLHAPTGSWDDRFFLPFAGTPSRGLATITGFAQFVPGYKVSSPPWKPGYGYSNPWSGSLHTIYNPPGPPPITDANSLFHFMSASWDCCPPKNLLSKTDPRYIP
jgi:RHS repeat-associated protein